METEVNLEVADREVRRIVENLKEKGFPEIVQYKEAYEYFTDDQNKAISELKKAVKKEAKVGDLSSKTVPGDAFWESRTFVRKKIQEAIKVGLIYIEVIKEQAVRYGAIPDPETDWKYYLLPDFSYACWRCGSEILVKDQAISVHDGPFPLSGSGKVEHRGIPYCPRCDNEPPERGVVKRDPVEELAEEMKIFSRVKEKN
jgi:hypothetical protein